MLRNKVALAVSLCLTASLVLAGAVVAGATVLEAELKVRDGRAVWKELELLEP